MNRFHKNTRLEKHAPLGAPPNPGGSTPITGNTFQQGSQGSIAVTPQNAQGLQGAFGLQYVDVSLSSAQILALLGTPVTLVPAPGVGFALMPQFCKIIFTGGGVAYTDAGGAVSLTLGTLSVALASNAIFLVTVSPNRRIQVLVPFAAAIGAGVTGTAANPPTEDNAALTLTKITNNFAAGTGTAKITIYYSIEPTT